MMMDNNPGMHMPQNRSCIPQEMVINNVELAHAYVPFQKLCTTFTPLSGLRKGTIFPPLYNVYSLRERGWR